MSTNQTRLFSPDLRSLAAFRIAVGLLILGDLFFLRWPDLHAHYAGSAFSTGFLAAVSTELGWHISLHATLAQAPAGLHVLFAFQTLLALALIVGWKTWYVAPLNWLLLTSLHAANFLVLDGGDALLRLLLLFGCFLPLGARWSVDAGILKRAPQKNLPECYRPAAACLMLQLACVYWFSIFFKTDPMWRESYDALYFAFNYPLYAKPLADLLTDYPTLLKILTFVAYWWEALGPLLVLFSWRKPWLRLIAIAGFLLFHTLIFLCFGLELFSLACMAGWLAFIPGGFWDLFARGQSVESEGIKRRSIKWIRTSQVLAVILFLHIALGNAVSVGGQRFHEMPQPFRSLATTLMLNQTWRAFSSEEYLSKQLWVVIEGRLSSGQWVNLVNGEAASNTLPEQPRRLFPNERWRHSVLMALGKKYRDSLPQLTRYYAQRWNDTAHPDRRVDAVRLRYCYDQTESSDSQTDLKPVCHTLFQQAVPSN